MSSPESRLSVGDGFFEVRAATTARPLDLSASPPLPLPVNQTVATGLGTARATTTNPPEPPPRDRDALPPLLSLSEMVLEAPPWLFSAALHMSLVIILGLLFISPKQSEEILLRFAYEEDIGEDISGGDLDVSLDLAESTFEPELTSEWLPEIEDPLSVPPVVVESPIQAQMLNSESEPIRMALSGREAGMQQALLDAYGGTSSTQQAVLEALRWLARNQGKGGMWSMRGKYSDGVAAENQEAATGMALLAFQGAGFTPHGDTKEPFTKIVTRAWRSLLKKQEKTGNFHHTGRGHGQLYTHAICTIALCELYGMTRDERYHEPAQRAIDYCVKIQGGQGGWRYFPGAGSDLSVTGWFVMALQSARMAGLEVPTPALDNIRGFLDSVSRESGSQYAYQTSTGATRSMTAEGLLSRQYLGWTHADGRLQRGADYLVEHLPSWDAGERNVYYWYYATQVCHHMEGRHWRTWNHVMRDLLPRHQVRKGREQGSWDPGGDEWGGAGGRLFVTCLSTYMLEVYYRHLPIYQIELLGGKF